MDGNDQDLVFPVFLWAVVPWAPSGTVGSIALAEGSAAPAPAASTGDAGLGGDGNFLPEQQALYFSLLPLPGNFLSLLKALGSVQLRRPASSAAQGLQPAVSTSDGRAQAHPEQHLSITSALLKVLKYSAPSEAHAVTLRAGA